MPALTCVNVRCARPFILVSRSHALAPQARHARPGRPPTWGAQVPPRPAGTVVAHASLPPLKAKGLPIHRSFARGLARFFRAEDEMIEGEGILPRVQLAAWAPAAVRA